MRTDLRKWLSGGLGTGQLPEPSEGQLSRLETFGHLLLERAIPLGLVGEGDGAAIAKRHLIDSMRAAAGFRAGDDRAVDIGSGAGLPGLVLAISLPGRRFLLIEPRRKAVAFLELAIERLELGNAEIFHGRVQDAPTGADIATSRAFAPLEAAWASACRVLRPGGRLVYFAGEGVGVEEARAIREPEHPARVIEKSVIASFAPLVIMDRAP